MSKVELDLANLTPEQIKMLKDALGIGRKEATAEQRREDIGTREGWTRLIQINACGKEYFCLTPEEKQIFFENNPGARNTEKYNKETEKMEKKKNSESFHIELPDYVAKGYLNKPDNQKQFVRKDK